MEEKPLIIILTYNERGNIMPLLEQIAQYYSGDLLFVDDNSPDGTGDLLQELARKDQKIKLIRRENKLGTGSAYRAAFAYAAELGYSKVLMMDADLQHPASAIPRLLQEDADFVVGSRYVEGGDASMWKATRHLISCMGNTFVRALLGMKIRDVTSGYNCTSSRVFHKVKIEDLKSKGFIFQVELKWRVFREGFVLKEIPISFSPRLKGKSKFSPGIIFEAFWRVLSLRFSR